MTKKSVKYSLITSTKVAALHLFDPFISIDSEQKAEKRQHHVFSLSLMAYFLTLTFTLFPIHIWCFYLFEPFIDKPESKVHSGSKDFRESPGPNCDFPTLDLNLLGVLFGLGFRLWLVNQSFQDSTSLFRLNHSEVFPWPFSSKLNWENLK